MKTAFKLSRVAFFVHAISLPLMASADTSADDNTVELNEIVVSGTPFSQQVGTQKITSQEISNQPTKSPSITGLLIGVPGSAFSNTYDTSVGAGYISPPDVSFHGAPFYSNNYMIDGFSNNDNINPGFGSGKNDAENPDGQNPWELPAGTTQSLWINPELLQGVEVFDSNVSAKYGRFNGAVVNAEIKDPDLSRASGKVYYRTTRSNWAKFHIYEPEQEEFEQATKYVNQPEFTKHYYGFQINQPIGQSGGILFAYDRAQSSIPFSHSQLRDANQDKATADTTYRDKQHQRSESFLLSGVYVPNDTNLLKTKIVYAPNETYIPAKNIANGGRKNKGGGLLVNLEWDHDTNWGKIETVLGYKQSGNEIVNNSDVSRQYRRTTPPSVPFRTNAATVNYGGMGSFKTQSATWTAKQDYSFKSLEGLGIAHKFNLGWQIDLTHSKYERMTSGTRYRYTNANIARLRECSDECILGAQYADQRIVYDPRKLKLNDSNYSLYVEDNLSWKRLEASIGLRYDRNKYVKNNDIAPRFSATVDVFGDGSTRIFGGLNRYYSNNVLRYGLSKGISQSYRQTRSVSTASGQLSDWSTPQEYYETALSYNDTSGLKTPYADEKVLGFAQKFYGMVLTAKWVHRDYKDQITRERNENKQFVPTNNGRSESDSYSLTLKPQETIKFKYAHFDWDLTVDIKRQKTNFTYYDSPLNSETDKAEKAIYRGELIDIDDLPPTNYNVPTSVKLNVNTYIPDWRLNWSQRLTYIGGGRSRVIVNNDIQCPSGHELCGDYGKKIIEYADEKHSPHIILDWRFSYKQPTFKDQYVELTLDINNVLNRKVSVSSTRTSKTYKMGRNFWLGVSYNW